MFSETGLNLAIKDPVIRTRELFRSEVTDTFPVAVLRWAYSHSSTIKGKANCQCELSDNKAVRDFRMENITVNKLVQPSQSLTNIYCHLHVKVDISGETKSVI